MLCPLTGLGTISTVLSVDGIRQCLRLLIGILTRFEACVNQNRTEPF